MHLSQVFSMNLFSVCYFKGVIYYRLLKWQLEFHINKTIKEAHWWTGESSRWVRGNLSSVSCEYKATMQSYCCIQRQMLCGCRLAWFYRSWSCYIWFLSTEAPEHFSSASILLCTSYAYEGAPEDPAVNQLTPHPNDL